MPWCNDIDDGYLRGGYARRDMPCHPRRVVSESPAGRQRMQRKILPLLVKNRAN